MAKSKSKSKKAKKANKSKKSAKQIKSIQSNKPTQKVQQKQQSKVEAKQLKKTRKISYALIAAVAIAVLIGGLLIGGAEDKSIKSSAKPTDNPNAQQTIEVRPPTNTKGRPEAADYGIQGSSPNGQTAPGGLQKPKSGLQPNAGIKDYENAEIN